MVVGPVRIGQQTAKSGTSSQKKPSQKAAIRADG